MTLSTSAPSQDSTTHDAGDPTMIISQLEMSSPQGCFKPWERQKIEICIALFFPELKVAERGAFLFSKMAPEMKGKG